MAKVLFLQNIPFEYMGPMYLSALLKKYGHQNRLLIFSNQKNILHEVRRKRTDAIIHTRSLEEEQYSEFEELMGKDHISILIDIPSPTKSGSSTPLKFIKETMEKRYLDHLPEDYMVQISDVWLNHVEDLMNSLAIVRIFCAAI